MPTLPLPSLVDGIAIDGGDLPVNSITDITSEWAPEIQLIPVDPIRDAIQEGQLGLFLQYQLISSYASAQSDPGRATEEYLDEILEEHGCPRQGGADDNTARDVMFSTPPVVSPEAIVQVANNILAPYTTTSCRYAEKSDGWFVGDGTTPWSSHVFPVAVTGQPYATPTYLDRPQIEVVFEGGGGGTGATAMASVVAGSILSVAITAAGSGYTTAPLAYVSGPGGSGAVLQVQILNGLVTNVLVVNGGSGYSEWRRPPGAMPNQDTYGRWFLLRVPDISSLDSELAAVFGQLRVESGAEIMGGFFVNEPTFPSAPSITDLNVTYLFDFAAATVDNIYNSLIAQVDAAVGAGIRWDLIADPLLQP